MNNLANIWQLSSSSVKLVNTLTTIRSNMSKFANMSGVERCTVLKSCRAWKILNELIIQSKKSASSARLRDFFCGLRRRFVRTGSNSQCQRPFFYFFSDSIHKASPRQIMRILQIVISCMKCDYPNKSKMRSSNYTICCTSKCQLGPVQLMSLRFHLGGFWQ